MQTLWQDLCYALRMLRKNLMLTVVIVVSLGIGIGANSAIFSVVDALLLRPLPYPHPERLAAVWLHSPAIEILRDWPSPGQYIDIQNENHSFEKMALAQSRTFVLTGREQPERVFGVRTQSGLLEMLGAKPPLGRLLLPEEDKPGKAPVVILSERVWRRLFNADPQIVGKTIVLNGNSFTLLNDNSFTVAGVLQAGFQLNAEVMPSEFPMDKMDLFLPLPLGPDAEKNRGDENYNIMVQLKPGASVQQAQADIDIIASRIREKDKRDASFQHARHSGLAGAGRWGRAPCAAGAVGVGRAGAVDRVCQRCKPATYARGGARERSGHSNGFGSRVAADSAAIIHREYSSGTSWRCGRALGGAAEYLCGAHDESRKYSSIGGHRNQ